MAIKTTQRVQNVLP